MSDIDRLEPNYDAHLSAVDTRTANRLMALGPEERAIDALGVPKVHVGFTGTASADQGDTNPETVDRGSTMHERREAGSLSGMRSVLDQHPGPDASTI